MKYIINIMINFVMFSILILLLSTCGSKMKNEDDDPIVDEYGNNQNGFIWTDPTTGYVWQKKKAELGYIWMDAIDYCKDLQLAEFDGWQLPTISELRTLIRECENTATGGSCGVTDSCFESDCSNEGGCYGCLYGEGPTGRCYEPTEFLKDCEDDWAGWPELYWSSIGIPDSEEAWGIDFIGGIIESGFKNTRHAVRCIKRE